VAGQIVLTHVRLGLHDAARCNALGRSTFQDGAQELARDDFSVARGERFGQRRA
jgi:hypothetical protein